MYLFSPVTYTLAILSKSKQFQLYIEFQNFLRYYETSYVNDFRFILCYATSITNIEKSVSRSQETFYL